jgi:hypothetical protein
MLINNDKMKFNIKSWKINYLFVFLFILFLIVISLFYRNKVSLMFHKEKQTTLLESAIFTQKDNESAEDFLIRNKPLTSAISKEPSSYWNEGSSSPEVLFGLPEYTGNYLSDTWNNLPVFVAFYSGKVTKKRQEKTYVDTSTYTVLDGYIYVKQNNNSYKRYYIGEVEPEGGDPIIESIFFANADEDLKQELVVILSWEQRHLDFSGTLYGVLVYDDIKINDKESLTYLADISNKLEPGCDCSGESNSSAKFKNKEGVLKELKRLGY